MAGYIGSKAVVVSSGAERKKVFTITADTTSLTGLAYTPGQVHVFHNGIRLVEYTDYVATDGSTISLLNDASAGDEVVVISYAAATVSDTVSASAGGTFSNDVAINGDLTVDTDALFVDAFTNNVGIGTSAPATALEIKGGDGVTAQVMADGNQGHFAIESTTTNYRWTLTNEGNVGRLRFMSNDGTTTRFPMYMHADTGIVTLPSQPSFAASYNVSPPQAWNPSNNGVLDFTDVQHNTGGHYDGTNRFTAPVAGRYFIYFAKALNTQGANQTIRHPGVDIYKNGANERNFNVGVSSGSTNTGTDYSHFTVSGSAVIDLAQNDYVQIRFGYDNSPSTHHEYARSYFGGYLLG